MEKKAPVYSIEPSGDGWLIRRGSVIAAHCAHRDSALELAHALARGERATTTRLRAVVDGERVS